MAPTLGLLEGVSAVDVVANGVALVVVVDEFVVVVKFSIAKTFCSPVEENSA